MSKSYEGPGTNIIDEFSKTGVNKLFELQMSNAPLDSAAWMFHILSGLQDDRPGSLVADQLVADQLEAAAADAGDFNLSLPIL